MYDLPALVEHVCQETGYDKVSASTTSLLVPLLVTYIHLFHFRLTWPTISRTFHYPHPRSHRHC